ncbi:NADH-ubiquinone oxidoreductase-F iron-sulfur binding region domain-containing protein [Terrabacter sp. 2RAF25]|uniref:NADH-ubiquinone oxidoreductase-F iron-sulfur binding region domain-containing protein n=1 Tax=Terrabacter sp. 2RAF25 TaxID=3232998 RepID=UPI003F9D1A3B
MSLTALLADAGLTGRGGAAFSTARKVEAAHAHGAHLIVNACDGELGAAKDGWVVAERLAELVDGAVAIAAGSPTTYAAHRGSGTAHRLRAAGLPVLEVPARYVSSEESSLISLTQGGLARPMTKRQPFVRGGRDSDGRRISPTVVLNAETVWRAGQVVRFGPDWFRSFGTAAEPGPRLVAVSTPTARGVVVETAAGAPVLDLLTAADPVAVASALVDRSPGVLLAGLGGTFVAPGDVRGLVWSDEGLGRVGARTGPGVVEVLDPTTCPVEFVDRCLTWAAGESAGQCGPCMFGLPALAAEWRSLARGDHTAYDRVVSRISLLPGRGACRFPDGVAGFAWSALRVFGTHLDAHRNGRCDAARQQLQHDHDTPGRAHVHAR